MSTTCNLLSEKGDLPFSRSTASPRTTWATHALRAFMTFVLALCVGTIVSPRASATVITPNPVYVTGVGYRYVDVVQTSSGAEIWFRVSANSCSLYDKKALILSRTVTSLANAKQFICTVKPYYDWGSLALGCGSAAGSAVCAVATVPSGGAAALACGAVVTYGLSTGYLDCLTGLSDLIGSRLAGSSYYPAAVQAGLSSGQVEWAISNAIDWACAHPN